MCTVVCVVIIDDVADVTVTLSCSTLFEAFVLNLLLNVDNRLFAC
jgi:hypothetical protein